MAQVRIDAMEQIRISQDSIINNQEGIIHDQRQQMVLTDQQSDVQVKELDFWKKKYRKEKGKKFIVGGVGLALVVLMVLVSG